MGAVCAVRMIWLGAASSKRWLHMNENRPNVWLGAARIHILMFGGETLQQDVKTTKHSNRWARAFWKVPR